MKKRERRILRKDLQHLFFVSAVLLLLLLLVSQETRRDTPDIANRVSRCIDKIYIYVMRIRNLLSPLFCPAADGRKKKCPP